MKNKKIEESKNLMQRLSQFLVYHGDNFNKLAIKIGISNSYFSKMQKSNGNIGSEIAEKILLCYENLNPDWLITEYVCIPHPKSESDVLGRYWYQLHYGKTDSSQRLQLMMYLISKIMIWY